MAPADLSCGGQRKVGGLLARALHAFRNRNRRGVVGMAPAEKLVLVAATLLAVVVLVERAEGTLTSRVGVLLLTLAILAASAAVLHMEGRL